MTAQIARVIVACGSGPLLQKETEKTIEALVVSVPALGCNDLSYSLRHGVNNLLDGLHWYHPEAPREHQK